MNEHARMLELAGRYAEGAASREEVAELEAILRKDDAARREFLRYLNLDAALGGASAAPRVEPARAESRKIAWLPWAALSAMAACLALAFLLTTRHGESPAEATSSAVAVLAKAVNATWEDRESARRVGSALEPGWLHLKSGIVQVEFYTGARVLVEGPADFQLVSGSEAFCPSGRVSAEVPPQARGFVIRTPQMRVVDLGTAFGLEVQPLGASVHVFKGQVEIHRPDVPVRGLVEGQAMHLANDGTAEPMPANPAAFASDAVVARQSAEALRRRADAWQTSAAGWNHAPGLLARFDFEDLSGADGVLRNLAAGAGDGRVVGCEPAQGRWPGKGALEFRSVSDRVRLSVPGEYRSVTFTAWVRVDGLDRAFNSLLMSDGYKAGATHWQINRQGVIHLGVQGPDERHAHDYGTPVVFTPERFGRWTHLAMVFDADAGRVTHYVDGAAVSSEPIRISVPLHIADAELGNWNAGLHSTIYPVRHFSGRMDEFCIFARALGETEVREMFAAGAPNFSPAP